MCGVEGESNSSRTGENKKLCCQECDGIDMEVSRRATEKRNPQ